LVTHVIEFKFLSYAILFWHKFAARFYH